MLAPPDLPDRFPCWCRAVYSWGGETKRDLGFMEGDLIECLNAGDGSWWMGRLKRDRRMVGLFPSNFVRVLDESFQTGGSRSVSPMPSGGGSIGSTPSPAPQSTPVHKKSTFRKPFSAHSKIAGPNPEAQARRVQEKVRALDSNGSSPTNSITKRTPYASMKRPSPQSSELRATSPAPPMRVPQASRSRAVSPAPPMRAPPTNRSRAPSPAPSMRMPRAISPAPSQRQAYYRAASPAPPVQYNHSRAPSPAPMHHNPYSRGPSPAPPMHHYHSRGPSPAPIEHDPYSRGPSPQPYHDQHDHYSRGPSPAPMNGHYDAYSRGPSPSPYEEDGFSPPPPAPPPHRVAYQPSRAPSPQQLADHEYADDYHSRPETPVQGVPQRNGFTPSPLTSAMNDVMSSLHTMSLSRRSSIGQEDGAPTPPSVWSPEAFDAIHAKSARKARAQTSLGITAGVDDDDEDDGHQSYANNPNSFGSQEHDDRVASYVERMESRLRKLHEAGIQDIGPTPPPKNSPFHHMRSRTQSNVGAALTEETPTLNRKLSRRKSLRHRRSAVELGKEMLGRTFTNKTNSTQHSSSTNTTQSTNHSLMSGVSASGISATSAGSLARRKFGLGSQRGVRPFSAFGSRADAKEAFGLGSSSRPETPFSGGVSYHSSHDSGQGFTADPLAPDAAGVLGGFTAPKKKKSGFFKRMVDSAKTGAKTSAATARSSISQAGSRPGSRSSKAISTQSISGGLSMPQSVSSSAARDMGLGGTSDWVQVRRDVNRSNSLSQNERVERAERCAMMDIPVLNPIDMLFETAEGSESIDGLPVRDPIDFTTANLALVDRSARFIQGIPPMTTSAALSQGYVARPYRSDVQRLRAIFTWVSERIGWEEEFEGKIDTRRVIQSKRGCAEEVAILVAEMCSAVGIHSEVVRGYLKTPGEAVDYDMVARPNHWWNTVLADGEWRIMDCSLASPSNPKRSLYSSAGNQIADGWFFLAKPIDVCFTHVPLLPEQQHVVPPLPHDVLMALPCACPPYFKHQLHLDNFDTSLCNLEGLEMAQVQVMVPEDVECVAEVETRALCQDADGDYFESGELIRKRALSQPEWVGGQKRYTVKALLPGEVGQGVLRVYAGKRGLMHSIKSNPHALAFALPIIQSGQNPPYNFLTLHPTPHAQRHDLYIAQPQCHRLAINNTFVFSVRQHPSSTYTTGTTAPLAGRSSPHPGSTITRPTSALSMASTSQAGSMFSAAPSTSSASTAPSTGSGTQSKPAKLAIQSPAGKIIRLMRRSDYRTTEGTEGGADGSTWETVIKIGERGVWRGLVLADRSARWCVFAEWECA